MNKRKYVYAITTRHDGGEFVIGLYGPRGGTVSTSAISLDQAISLRDQLDAAIKEREAS